VDLKRLRRLVREVDDQHRPAMREIHDELDSSAPTSPGDLGDLGDRSGHDSRRTFLRGVGLGGAALTVGGSAVALAATGAGAQTSTTAGDTATTQAAGTTAASASTVPASTTTEVRKAPTAEDVEILSFAQTLELALVEVYGAALATGKLAEDVLPLVAAFRDHHLQHGQAYAGPAGKAALNVANAGLVDEYVPRIEGAADQAAVLTVLFELENSAAASYTGALAEVRGLDAAATMANILPIESRHAVVLGETLGLDLDEYVPSFEDPEKGFDPDQYPVSER
jgi:hypothetical protein